MDRIILIAISALLVSFSSEVVLASSRYDSIELRKFKEDDKNSDILLTPPRLGRRKRNLKDEAYKLSDQELVELWDVFGESPTTVITINGNEKFICKTMQVNRDTPEFVPRLGRNDDFSGGDKWLREAEGDERSPPFAPRLGRRLSPFSPRLGREI